MWLTLYIGGRGGGHQTRKKGSNRTCYVASHAMRKDCLFPVELVFWLVVKITNAVHVRTTFKFCFFSFCSCKQACSPWISIPSRWLFASYQLQQFLQDKLKSKHCRIAIRQIWHIYPLLFVSFLKLDVSEELAADGCNSQLELPTTHRPPTDHQPTTNRPPTDWPPTDHVPTTLIPTTLFTVQLVHDYLPSHYLVQPSPFLTN